LQRARRGLIDRTEDLRYFILDDGPIVRREDNDGEPSSGQVLLVNKGGVARDEDLESIAFRSEQQFAIFERTPPFVGRRDDLMIAENGELRPQFVRKVLIEQHSHEAKCARRDLANDKSRRIVAIVKSG
jgi:hypothetical protein